MELTQEEIDKMRKCCVFLGAPANEVVVDLLTRYEELQAEKARQENERLVLQRALEISAGVCALACDQSSDWEKETVETWIGQARDELSKKEE